MKRCTKCKEHKSFSEFSKHPGGKNGLRSHCKKCRNDYQQKYQQIKRVKQLRNEASKKYKQTIKGYLHGRFYAMKQRCEDSKHPGYKRYGGRGIKCLFKSSDELVDYVLNELQIDPRGLTTDRIDNNGNYEPGNIRFITQAENNKNR